MTPFTYQAYARKEEPGCWLVQFYDVPEAITQGEDLGDAKMQAADALAAALEEYVERGRAFPARTDVRPADVAVGFVVFDVAVDPKVAARGLLAAAMREKGVSKVGLGQLMGRDEKTVRRILGGQGASLDLTLEALRAIGVRPALAA